MSRKRCFVFLLSVALCGAPASAWAADEFHDLSVAAVTGGEKGQLKLLDVPFYMAGQSHGKVLKSLGTFTSNRRVNAFGRDDMDACESAFISAIVTLQKRAQALGGNAVIDVRSVTKHNDLSSASEYRCAAGFAVANVALEGRVVNLAR